MVLRRGTGGFYMNGLAARNVVLAENAAGFDPGAGTFTFDATGNAIVTSPSATPALFTAFPATVSATTTAASFDWRPPTGSPAASGGLATFTGKIAARATGASLTGNGFTGTSYVGAAQPGGAQWWAGWTVYSQN